MKPLSSHLLSNVGMHKEFLQNILVGVPYHQETNSKRYDYFQDKAHPAKELSKKFERVSAKALPRPLL
jgi:hypothetical protein